MENRKPNVFSILSFIFLALFICGVGTFNQMKVFSALKLTMVEAVLGLICMLISILVYERGKLSVNGALKWLAPIAVIIVSGIIGNFAVDYLIYFLLFFIYMLWGCKKRYEVGICVKIVFIFGMIVTVSVFIDFFFTDLFRNFYLLYSDNTSILLNLLRNNNYTSGITIQPALAALYIVITIGITAFLADFKKPLKYALIIILFIALLLTGKRTSSIAVLVSMIIVYLIDNRGSKQWFVKLLKAAVIIYGLYIAFSTYAHFSSNSNSFLRFFLLFENSANGQNILSQRANLWQMSLDLFYEHPILGAGWGVVSSKTQSWSETASSLATHNIYIQLLAETGIIGSVMFLLPFVTEYFTTIKALNDPLMSENNARLMRFAVFWQSFFFVYGFTGNPIYDLCPLCVFFLSVIMANTASDKLRYKRLR